VLKYLYGFGGFVFALVLLAASGYVAVFFGLIPPGADNPPSKLERWASKTALQAAIRRETAGMTNPYLPTSQTLLDGIRLYGAHCAVCHGAADGQPSKIAQGLYVEAPMLAKNGVEDDPVPKSFWIIKHGVRLTAMPGFAGTLSDKEIWEISGFLERMDKLPRSIDAVWKRVPSAAGK
jgi:mono/diheme cytochrome c family protein